MTTPHTPAVNAAGELLELPEQPKSGHSAFGDLTGSYVTTEIDTGDWVKHRPSGEEWVVAYVRRGKLAACGWPDTLEDLSDCELVRKATPDERLGLLHTLAASTGHRAENAKRVLAALATQGVQLAGGLE